LRLTKVVFLVIYPIIKANYIKAHIAKLSKNKQHKLSHKWEERKRISHKLTTYRTAPMQRLKRRKKISSSNRIQKFKRTQSLIRYHKVSSEILLFHF